MECLNRETLRQFWADAEGGINSMKQALAVGVFIGLVFVGLQLGQHLIAGFGASPVHPAPAPPSA